MINVVFTEVKVYRRVETLAGHADSAYAVLCGYALMTQLQMFQKVESGLQQKSDALQDALK